MAVEEVHYYALYPLLPLVPLNFESRVAVANSFVKAYKDAIDCWYDPRNDRYVLLCSEKIPDDSLREGLFEYLGECLPPPPISPLLSQFDIVAASMRKLSPPEIRRLFSEFQNIVYRKR